VSARPDASLTRRRFLLGGLGGVTVLALGARTASGTSRRSPASAGGRPAGLRIDVHSRVFNGQDVQLARLLERVVASEHPAHARMIRAGASVAQALAWALAPSGAEETWRLEALIRRRGPALGGRDDSDILHDQREADRRFRDALSVVLPGTEFFRLYLERLRPPARAVLGRAVDRRLARMAGAGILDRDDVDFLLGPDGPERALLTIRPLAAFRRYTYYRYLLVSDVLRPDTEVADVVVPTVAVFDGAPRGRVPPTAPRDQLIVLARLVTLGGGRLHPLAPFDPREPADAGETLALVQDAVEQRGFVGVTLTAAPTGPAAEPVSGVHALLEWCAREEVPVVMPAGPPSEAAALLARHPGLRLGLRARSGEDLGGSRWRDGSAMRGIDWMRRSLEGSAREIHRAETRDVAPAVPDDAVEFLGLRRRRRTRERLERFYDRQRMRSPAWMSALDAEPSAPG
jgi:hypothetical protein